MAGESGVNFVFHEVRRLLGGAAGVVLRRKQLGQMLVVHGEGGVGGDALHQVALLALLLHARGRGLRMHADALVQRLPVAAQAHALHEDGLRGHEGQVFHHALADHRRIDDHAAGDVGVEFQHRVRGQKGFRQREAAVGAVVQRALEPLGGGGHLRVLRQRHHVAGKGADALRAHGIALVGHGRGADLALLKRLFHLAEGLQQPQILRELVGALGDAGERAEHAAVQFARIGLAGNGKALLHAHLAGDAPFQLVHLFAVAVEELHKALLRAGRAAVAQQLEGGKGEVHFIQIHQQILHPQGGALAHGGELRRLQMGVAEGGQIFIFQRKGAQAADDLQQLFAHQRQGVAQHEYVGVVGHVAGSRAQVDDAARIGADVAIGEHVGHDVVTGALLVAAGGLVVDVLDMRL